MTRNNTLTLASALMAVAFIATAPVQAQAGGPPPGAAGPGHMGGRMEGHHGPMMGGRANPPSVDERVQRMSGELNLTPDQTVKVKALLTAEQRSADSIRAVRAVQWQAERKAMEARHAEHEKALLALLTPEQKTKHDALMKARGGMGMMRGRGHGAPGAPPMGGPGMRRGPGGDEGSEH